jgi:thiol-disulfide isomerase/thioredoxin
MKGLISFLSLAVVGAAVVVGADGVQQKTVQAAIQPIASRAAAPAFSLADASGTIRRLSDYLGRPVVINLWATDCGGCRAELPEFVKLSKRHPDVTIVGVSLDIMYEDLKSATEGWARVKPFAASHGLSYPILLDDGSVEKAYKVTALPATYLVDRDGRVAATYIGVVDAADLETNINAILAER